MGGTCHPRGPRGGNGPEEPQVCIGPVSPHFINLHVKCLILMANDDEDAEGYLLHSNNWMNSQGITEDEKKPKSFPFHLTCKMYYKINIIFTQGQEQRK